MCCECTCDARCKDTKAESSVVGDQVQLFTKMHRYLLVAEYM